MEYIKLKKEKNMGENSNENIKILHRLTVWPVLPYSNTFISGSFGFPDFESRAVTISKLFFKLVIKLPSVGASGILYDHVRGEFQRALGTGQQRDSPVPP